MNLVDDRDPPRSGAGGLVARVRREPLLLAVPVWVAAQLVWVRTFRWSGFAELDEAAYTRMAARVAAPSPWRVRANVLGTDGVHGPLQALLTAPAMEVLGRDVRVLVALNVAAVAVAAVGTAALVARVADRRAGTVAGALVLLSPTAVQLSHTALTAVLPMAAAAVALAALARSDGLRRTRWCAAAGLALGAMVLGRSMAVGFLPALAVAGLGWAWSTRTPWPRALRGGAVTVAATAAVAVWWWVARWGAVTEWLLGGGSTDTPRGDRLAKTGDQVLELAVAVGPALVAVVVAVTALALRDRRPRGPGTDGQTGTAADAEDGEDDAGEVAARPALALWPLWAAVATGLATLAASAAPGVAFTVTLVPAAVAAATVTLRRAGDGAWWRPGSAAALAVGLLVALALPGRGLDLGLVWGWCRGDDARAVQCTVRSDADGRAWRQANDAVADRIVAFDAAVAPPGEVATDQVALTPRDSGVTDTTVALSLELRHRAARDLTTFLDPDGGDHEAQLARVVERAGLLVAVEDAATAPIVGLHAPTTAVVLATAREAGFRPCGTVALPDGRDVEMLVAPWVPAAACVPLR